MAALHRARLALLVAICVAGILLIVEMPLGEVFAQRQQLSRASGALSTVTAENNRLRSEVSALNQRSTIGAIAHEEYGLVGPGQQSVVVLPGAKDDAGAADTLSQSTLPVSSLVSGDANALLNAPPAARATSSNGASTSGSLWGRVADRLAFWRWAF